MGSGAGPLEFAVRAPNAIDLGVSHRERCTP